MWPLATAGDPARQPRESGDLSKEDVGVMQSTFDASTIASI